MQNFIGLHPLDSFEESISSDDRLDFILDWILSATEGLIAVESVDSSLRQEYEADWSGFWLDEEAHLGKFALMLNRKLTTDFIFDEITQLYEDFDIATDLMLVSARIGDNWGLIDANGDVFIPFMFDNLVLIDRYTAFAKLDGVYGILDIR